MLNYICTVYMGLRMKCVSIYVDSNKYILGEGHSAVLEQEGRSNDVFQFAFACRRCSCAVPTFLTWPHAVSCLLCCVYIRGISFFSSGMSLRLCGPKLQLIYIGRKSGTVLLFGAKTGNELWPLLYCNLLTPYSDMLIPAKADRTIIA
jgi:hypothetical protein